MKLDFVFLSDAATIMDDGRFDVIGGGFDHIRSKVLPMEKGAMVVVGRVSFEVNEIGETFDLRADIVGPGGKLIREPLWLSLKPIRSPINPQSATSITICVNYQVVRFETPGNYSVRLSVSGQSEPFGEVFFQVIEGG
jgi:hypothetical protein